MVKLNAYNMVSGKVQTLHTWRAGHRAWSLAYRMLSRMVLVEHDTDTALYLSAV